MSVRKLVFLSCAIMVLAVLVGCASTGSAAPIGNATGTATGTAQGFGGEILVTITMANGFITDVVVVGDKETPSVGSIAIIRAPKMIKKNNSADLDSISGATVTANGISQAAQAAIDKIVAGK